MPVIGAGNSVINTQTTSNAQATTGTAATTATTATAQGNVTVVGNPNASGAKKEQFREVAGLPAGLNLGDLTKNNGGANGATQGLTGEYIARPSGQSSYLTGYGDVTRIDPTIDGFEVDVQIYVQKATDEIALILQLPLLDKKSGKPPWHFKAKATLKSGDWVIAIARGTKPMTYLYRSGATPFGFTNPIFVH